MSTKPAALNWLSVSVLLFSGALLPLAFAPYGLWPCALISTAVFYHLLHAQPAKRCSLRAFIFGLGLFGHGASWVYVSIHDFGFTGVPLAILLTGLFVIFLSFVFSLPFYIYGHVYGQGHNTGSGKKSSRYSLNSILLFSAIWVIGEWLRSWLFTGFPWLYIGYGHIDSPLASFAPIGGVFFLSFLSLTLSCFLLNIAISLYRTLSKMGSAKKNVRSRNRAAAIQAIAVVATLVVGFILNNVEWTEKVDEPQTVSLVQPNVSLERKWDPYSSPGILEELDDAANEHWHSDIQVWPEAAIPSLYHDIQFYIDDVQNRATNTQTNVISGVLYDNQEPFEIYNSIIGIGSASGVYFKQKLVPFGEYVPLEDYLRGVIAFFDLPNSIIRRGPYRSNAITAKTQTNHNYIVAPFICYEVVYPDFVAANSADADLLVTISNDAWFGRSIGPHQHLEMVRMRALENQKYFARSTNTGISAIINHHGKITLSSKQFVQDVITGTVELRTGQTPFTILGSYPIILFCFAICIFSFSRKRFNLG